jgi:putative spermidine/putrescine transport system substrate-binding protein
VNLTRRQLLAGAATSLLVPRFALAQENQLVVGTWGGDFGELLRTGVDEPLMKPKGISVVQDVGAPTQRRTKLLAERQARRSSQDVACLADFDMYAAGQAGALEPISAQNVPRVAQVLPFLKRPNSIPHIYSAYVIVYNTDFVKTPPTSFADLWDPKYKGKVGLTDFQFTTNTVIAAVVGGGSPTNLAPANAKLLEWRANDLKVLPSTEALAVALKSGDIWFTIIAAARCHMWKQSGIPLARVVPKEGAMPTLYEAGVAKNARNKETGLKYLDAMLEVSAQLAFATKMGYLPTVADAKLPADLEASIGFTEAERNRMWEIDYDHLSKNQAQMLDFWTKSVKG